MNDRVNLVRIKVVNDALEELKDDVVFVGGATVAMYRDRPAAESRITDDVDLVVELTTYKAFAEIEDKLRKKGFENDLDSGIICRYSIKGIIVDVMPSDGSILGFKNQWYPDGCRNAIEFHINETDRIKIFSAVYFLASKLNAFNDRGNNDGRTSSDFEDIVYILNNRSTIWDEMENASREVKLYLKVEFTRLINEQYFDEWISVHLEYSEQRRVGYIVGGLRHFVTT
jgi:predicted nucleotidyltransferase